jgi:probable F420-dependent oxidoreductase
VSATKRLRLGVVLRVMGAASQPELLRECAQLADRSGIDDLWVVDHIAIPPDETEGSGGRYLDALATLAYLAAATERIGLGTSVLVLPYRQPLPTAKSVATIQELSGGRLLLGVGVGWMKPEFKALGVPREERGRRTDRVLDTLQRCFEAADDIVVENEQAFVFRPRPARPPIFVGGAPPHALERAVRYGDGWMPMGGNAEKLAPSIAQLRELAEAAGRPTPEVVSLGGLAPGDPQRGAAQLHALVEAGVTRFVAGSRYDDLAGFRQGVESVLAARDTAGLGS